MGAVSYNRSTAGVWNVSNVVSFRSMFENAITFDRDLSPFELSSAQELDRMFYNATGFNQNLCAWMSQIPEDASVVDMFVGTNCPDEGDPDLKLMPVNPLCHNDCTLEESTLPTVSPGSGGVPAPPTFSPVAPPITAPITAPTLPTSGASASYLPLTTLALVTVWMMKK